MLVPSFSPREASLSIVSPGKLEGLQGPRSLLNALGCGREPRGPVNEMDRIGAGVEGSLHFLWVARFNRWQLILLRTV